MRALIAAALWSLLGCGTELVELATLDAGRAAGDTGVVDSGVGPVDTGVVDLGFPDLGFADAAEDTGPDSGPDAGADTGVEDTGVTAPICLCRLRCSTNPECAGVDPTSTCVVGYCSTPPAAPGCQSDADCVARALCLTVAEPVTGCR
jgi:hypothetical protein